MKELDSQKQLTYEDYLKGTQDILDASKEEKEPYKFSVLGREIIVNPNVFSPKYFHDTELFAKNMPVREGESILEIGPGTGAISISCIDKGARSVVAIDINPDAVQNTRENIELSGMAERVDVRQGDLFNALKEGEKFDTIFWNTPFGFVDEAKVPDLEKAVFDPGYKSTEKFIKEAPRHLNDGGRILSVLAQRLGDSIYSKSSWTKPGSHFVCCMKPNRKRCIQ